MTTSLLLVEALGKHLKYEELLAGRRLLVGEGLLNVGKTKRKLPR